MPLAPEVEDGILDWIASVGEGEDLDVTYARCGTVEATALSILRRRRGTTGPGKWSLSGDYAEDDAGATVAWLDSQIAALRRLTGDTAGDAATVGRVRRIQPCR